MTDLIYDRCKNTGTIVLKPFNSSRYLNEDMIAKVRELKTKGLSIAKIEKQTSISRYYIKQILDNREDVPTNGRPRNSNKKRKENEEMKDIEKKIKDLGVIITCKDDNIDEVTYNEKRANEDKQCKWIIRPRYSDEYRCPHITKRISGYCKEHEEIMFRRIKDKIMVEDPDDEDVKKKKEIIKLKYEPIEHHEVENIEKEDTRQQDAGLDIITKCVNEFVRDIRNDDGYLMGQIITAYKNYPELEKILPRSSIFEMPIREQEILVSSYVKELQRRVGIKMNTTLDVITEFVNAYAKINNIN